MAPTAGRLALLPAAERAADSTTEAARLAAHKLGYTSDYQPLQNNCTATHKLGYTSDYQPLQNKYLTKQLLANIVHKKPGVIGTGVICA
uniref:Alkaline phosphatase n=1 Tax=Steinernema glaseri TaxID=37863 RepID=A0A1I7YY92_9BILA